MIYHATATSRHWQPSFVPDLLDCVCGALWYVFTALHLRWDDLSLVIWDGVCTQRWSICLKSRLVPDGCWLLSADGRWGLHSASCLLRVTWWPCPLKHRMRGLPVSLPHVTSTTHICPRSHLLPHTTPCPRSHLLPYSTPCPMSHLLPHTTPCPMSHLLPHTTPCPMSHLPSSHYTLPHFTSPASLYTLPHVTSPLLTLHPAPCHISCLTLHPAPCHISCCTCNATKLLFAACNSG